MASLDDLYALGTEGSNWSVKQDFAATFDWKYDASREALLRLYAKGKEMQWEAATRIDWSREVDENNPLGMPDDVLPISCAPCFHKMSEKQKGEIRRHFHAWQLSQFLQGEQGALICAAKIVTQVPDADAKFYAATQTLDEARHVEVFRRMLEKIGLAYPMTKPLQVLLEQTLRDSRWDLTYLGMQVVIEGLALAVLAQIRDRAENELFAQAHAYVMQDESRHVAFGRLALREYYPQLTQKERDEREQFLLEACYLMRDRFDAIELWQNLGLPIEECARAMYESGFMERYRSTLFTRIVPIVKDIGLWGAQIRRGYAQMGILGYADADVQALQDQDENIAKEFDARHREVQRVLNHARNMEPGDPETQQDDLWTAT